jgi:hypothetical protein
MLKILFRLDLGNKCDIAIMECIVHGNEMVTDKKP